METFLYYLIDKKLLFYFLIILFVFTLLKLKMRLWWRILNLVTFASYFSFSMYWIFSNIYHDEGFGVSLVMSFVILLHLAFLLIVYFIAKRYEEKQ